ncbi:MAG: tetratricopeptide repeat protein [Kofleriaceae bacterium]|nr:tetratricopeptide repeat protein [Kofleriaceae bacterium]
MLRLRGDLDGALARYREALAIKVAALGEDHVDTALTHNSIALVLMARGDLDGAERELRLALPVFEAAGHGERAMVLHNLGLIAQRRGDHRAALARFDEAGLVYVATIGPDAAAPVRLLVDRAESERALGDRAAARRDAAEAARRAEAVEGDEGLAIGADAEALVAALGGTMGGTMGGKGRGGGGPRAEVGAGAGTGERAEIGAGTGTGTGTGERAEIGAGTGTGTGERAEFGAGTGTGTGERPEVGAGTGTDQAPRRDVGVYGSGQAWDRQ